MGNPSIGKLLCFPWELLLVLTHVQSFFSFDRRRTDDGKRWSAEFPFGNRAYFQENPYISNLIIKDVRKEVLSFI